MRSFLLLAGLVACLVSDAAATALTYKLSANEKACFFARTKKENEKIAFYFAVGRRRMLDTTFSDFAGSIRWLVRRRLHC